MQAIGISGQDWILAAGCAVLVVFSGLMAGLTLGLLSLDKIDVEVIKRAGNSFDRWAVSKVEPVRLEACMTSLAGESGGVHVRRNKGRCMWVETTQALRQPSTCTAPLLYSACDPNRFSK